MNERFIDKIVKVKDEWIAVWIMISGGLVGMFIGFWLAKLIDCLSK